jgi:hypothetical protein
VYPTENPVKRAPSPSVILSIRNWPSSTHSGKSAVAAPDQSRRRRERPVAGLNIQPDCVARRQRLQLRVSVRGERQIPYARERFFKGAHFNGLADMRDQARRWCLEIAGQRVHGTTQRLPLVVIQEEEQAKLLPWDGEPYDVPDWHRAKVHQDHHIWYRYAIYSAPYSTCPPGTELEVRGDSHLVRLYRAGKLVKVHPRKPRGGRSTDPDDYPGELTPYTLRSPNYLRRQSAELGESVGAFADKLLGGPTPWSKMRQAFKLLRLGEKYTALRLEAACAKALAVDLIDVRRLERILTEALEQEAMPVFATPAPPPGRFARPATVFSILGGNHSGNHGGNHLGDQNEKEELSDNH